MDKKIQELEIENQAKVDVTRQKHIEKGEEARKKYDGIVDAAWKEYSKVVEKEITQLDYITEPFYVDLEDVEVE